MTESIPLWKRVGIHQPKCSLGTLHRPRDQNVNSANQQHQSICQENSQTPKSFCRCMDKSSKPESVRRNTIQFIKSSQKNLPLQRLTLSSRHQDQKYYGRSEQASHHQEQLTESLRRHLRQQILQTDAEVQKLKSIILTAGDHA